MTTTGRNPRRLVTAVALALLFTIPAAAPSFAQRRPLAPPPPAWAQKPIVPYAGDCGDNPPPGYRYDLQGWRTGFNRDFYCYMLDEG
ncbi:hypothetical protein [Methylocystis echinoides]|jgi:hypothetical protein|uniref:hypothetical protein n=1 Tax=Methylocystis echinoides TaxID=29468 RepID=UPI00343FD063